MRDETNNSPPATTQASPASLIFDLRDWALLTPAFGQYMAIAGGRIAGVRDDALDCINRDVHEWRLRLGLRAPGSMTIRVPDASECQKLTVHAAHNPEEAVWIKPDHDGRWYVWRADLERLTTIPATPAAHAEPVSSGPPLTEPPRSSQSPQAEPVSPGAETGQEESSARPPSDKELNGFVAGFIKTTTDAKRIPTKTGLYQAAHESLPGATRKRLSDAFELQAKTLPRGRPRKNRQ
jgi:hypothetical protein